MKVIVYARKSSESEERQALSIEAQLTELREFAAREQLEIVASLCEAKTAKEPGRTEFTRVLHMLEQGEAEGILSWHPDRLARNSVDGGQIIHLLDTGKLKSLFFPTLTFENNPQGKFMLAIAFGQGKYFVDSLSENVKRGIRQKLRRGEWSWGAPVGYINNRNTRNIDHDPEKAPIVRKAFELYATGVYTLPGLQKTLKDLGLRSRKDYALSVSCVQAMLTNPLYCGMMRVGGELHPGSFEPLIRKDLFDKVQEVMKGKSKRKQRRRKHEFLFSGLMSCGSCGCSITAETQKEHNYYRCTKRKGLCEEKKYLREEKLLDQVREIVEQVSLPDSWADNMLRKLDGEKEENLREHQAAMQHLREEKESIDKKLSDLLDLKLDGALDTAEYVAKKNSLVSRKVKIGQEIADVEKNPDKRLEPVRELIIRSRETKNLIKAEDWRACAAFVKMIGSNALLKENALWLEAKQGWRIVQNRATFSGWCARQDLNLRPPAPQADALSRLSYERNERHST